MPMATKRRPPMATLTAMAADAPTEPRETGPGPCAPRVGKTPQPVQFTGVRLPTWDVVYKVFPGKLWPLRRRRPGSYTPRGRRRRTSGAITAPANTPAAGSGIGAVGVPLTIT